MKEPTHKVDDYQSPDFYRDHTTNPENGFATFEHASLFYFCYYLKGDITLLSQAYTSAAGCETGKASVKKNISLEKRYRFDVRKNGRYGFYLRAGNYKEIAQSCDFDTEALALAAAHALMDVKHSKPKKRTQSQSVSKTSANIATQTAHRKPKAKVSKPKTKTTKKTTASAIAKGVNLASNAAEIPQMAKRALAPPPIYTEVPIAPKFPIAARMPVTAKRPSLALDAPVRPQASSASYAYTEPSLATGSYDGVMQSKINFRWLLWGLPLLILIGAGLLGFRACTSMSSGSNPPLAKMTERHVTEILTPAPLLDSQIPVKPALIDVKASEANIPKTNIESVTEPTRNLETKRVSQPILGFTPELVSQSVEQISAKNNVGIRTERETVSAPIPVKPRLISANAESSERSFEIVTCAPSDNILFDVSPNMPVLDVKNLSSHIEFGNAHGLTPAEFYDRLMHQFLTRKFDQQFLDFVFRSIGYEKGFKDATPQMFSNITVEPGVKGVLGYGDIHGMQVIKLDVADRRDLEAFHIQSANGKNVSFLKTSGSFLHMCR